MESEKFEDIEVEIRPGKKEDMVAIARLIHELAAFQGMPDGPKLRAEDLQTDGFETNPPAFQILVAQNKKKNDFNEIVGYALYFKTYSTWEGLSMMLEDLYVKPTYRRQGIGKRLFYAVTKEASLAKSSRLDFHVLEWNPARSFYESTGAVNLTKREQWCYYRLTGEAFKIVADHK